MTSSVQRCEKAFESVWDVGAGLADNFAAKVIRKINNKRKVRKGEMEVVALEEVMISSG